jgi:catechol 2,3-dioxygenase-like lactoylglutathione lyase family enzyme
LLVVRIDHVIYATADLDAAAARVASELGLSVVAGGRHDGHGTHNRIVPLGGGYLELMAVADPAEAADSPIGSAVQAWLAEHAEGLFAWAVEVEDLDSVAARLGSRATTVTREGFSARLVGVAEALRDPWQPFFIARDHAVPDPDAGADVGGITWVEVAADTDRLERRLGGAELPLRIVEGASGLRAMGIGERELRNT